MIRRLALVLFLLGGCVSLTPLTPEQERSLSEVRALADATAGAYGLPRISVLIGSQVQGVGGTYRRGLFTLGTSILTSRHRDAIVAHELAHYVLGHDRPLEGPTSLDFQRQQELRELDANATAVEILVRVRGLPEEQALRQVYEHLLGFHRLVLERRTVVPWGHRLPCAEITDLLSRFPGQRAWTASLECSGRPS